MKRTAGVDVQCITCKKVKFIGRAEAERLTIEHRIAMCDDCAMPMVVKRAYA